MINVLLPAMGKSAFFKDSYFPKILYEINGKTMLEMIVEDYNVLEPKNFIFVFSDEECIQFHIDDSAKMLSDKSKVIRLQNQTAGALCTCLMAVEEIDNNTSLVIANCDQIIDVDYQKVIGYFEECNADAGVIIFPSIHPRWSYAKKEGEEIVEVAEKRPLSKDAIAGFYYFKQGTDFVESAKKALLKRSCHEGRYYISSAINELILMGKKICYYDIEKEQYKSFYSPAKIKEYEESLR